MADDSPDLAPVPIAVLGASTLVRDAILNAVDKKAFKPVIPEDAQSWSIEPGSKLIVKVLRDEEDWTSLDSLAELPHLVLIALIPELRVDQYVRALAAGCQGVAHHDNPSEVVASVVTAAYRSEALIPVEAAQAMARATQAKSLRLPPLTQIEVDLLRDISDGRSIVELARRLGWSDRTIRRQLQGIFMKLGVNNKPQAIAEAVRLGVL